MRRVPEDDPRPDMQTESDDGEMYQLNVCIVYFILHRRNKDEVLCHQILIVML